MNLVMASCSHVSATSVVELTSSRHFHYHYSNISKVSDNLCKEAADYDKFFNILLSYFASSCEVSPSFDSNIGYYYSFSQDMCMVSKSASACLENKVYGHQANSLGTGVVEGYKLGFTHLHAGKGWALPVAIEMVAPEGNATDLAVKQLDALMTDNSLPFGKSFCLNNADSGYGNARYLSPLYKRDNLINIVRLRAGMKVYPVFKGEQKLKSNPMVYGQTYYLNSETTVKKVHYHDKKNNTAQTKEKLQTSIMDYAFDSYSEETIILGNDRKATRKVWRWNNMLIRSKHGNNMKDKPFDLLKIEIWNEEQSAKIFDRDMFLAVTGQNKDLVSSELAVAHYRTRFDVEGCYRFSKQDMFLGKFQTPDKLHFLSYLLVILSSWWLLYAGKDEVELRVPVWQQYLPENKEVVIAKEAKEKAYFSPSQVRKGMADLFDTFDKKPYLPVKSKKGNGRKKGTVLPTRVRYKTVKKGKKASAKDNNRLKKE